MKRREMECSKCQYWHEKSDKSRDGECRVNPPIHIDPDPRVLRGGWLVTMGEEWCGSFEPERSKIQNPL